MYIFFLPSHTIDLRALRFQIVEISFFPLLPPRRRQVKEHKRHQFHSRRKSFPYPTHVIVDRHFVRIHILYTLRVRETLFDARIVFTH